MAVDAFLSENGDKAWIKNFKTVPPKLKKLLPLMQTLWSKPWTLSKQYVKVTFNKILYVEFIIYVSLFQNLTVGSDSWNLAQLVQAVGMLY